MKLTQKETALLKDLKASEELCIEKYGTYAERAEDPELKQLFETWAEGDDSELFKTAEWWEKLLKDECGDRCEIKVLEADCYDTAWQEWFQSGHEYGVRDKAFLDKGLYDILNFLLIYVRKGK